MFPSDILPSVYPKETNYEEIDEILETNIFNVMLNRRSQRKFEDKQLHSWKAEIIFASADTAQTAVCFPGFEIFHITNDDIKKKLVTAANNQPYLDTTLVGEI